MRMVDWLYRAFSGILFMIKPEEMHNTALLGFKIAGEIEGVRRIVKGIFGFEQPFEYMGLNFKNPIGLAAGFDKNAEVFDVVEALGFGFCEVGSVSLKPQKGNPKPRIFRIVDEEALINHIGLENNGSYAVAKNIERKRKRITFPLGINIVKNNDVDLKDAANNIFECFRIMKDLGDFFVFNISCPNVEFFHRNIYDYISEIGEEINRICVKKPKFIKLSPDLDNRDLELAVKACKECGFGIVAGNTSRRRDILKNRCFDLIDGGVSGKPLNKPSSDMLEKIRKIDNKVDVISCGGIFEKKDIELRRTFGVRLFEIYTSFIYYGPGIIRRLLCDVR
ncbi:MAG: quinone-dependent dihydroorotate dehydrogenase [Elusimicrobiales bacterium]